MQPNYLRNTVFAVLAGLALPAAAMAQSSLFGAAGQPAISQANDDISRFYAASKNSPIWFRAGQASAGPALVNILKRSPIEGFARGPQLAAQVESALASAQTGDSTALIAADRVLSAAWVAYVQALHAPTPGMLYGEKWVTPTVPTTFAVMGKALKAPSLADHLKIVSDINPI